MALSNRGKPSKGCKRCLSKKIKCDETHPACLRCQKAGIVCEWRDEFEIFHRSQTKAAERMAKDKWRQRAIKHPDTQDILKTETPPLSPFSNSTSGSPQWRDTHCDSVSGPLNTQVNLHPWLEQMVHLRFFFDFVTSLECQDRSHGVLGPVPTLFSNAPPDSHFRSVVSAVSYANFGARYKSGEALRKGAIFYGKALRQYAEIMASPSESVTANELLLEIFMLGTYENLTSGTMDGSYKMHQNGAASILQARQSDSSLNNAAYEPHLGTVYTQVLMSALSEAKEPPVLSPTWKPYLDSNPRAKLVGFMSAGATLRYKFIQVEQVRCSPSRSPSPFSGQDCVFEDTTAQLIEDGLALELKMKAWSQVIESDMYSGKWSAPVPIHPRARPPWIRELFSLPGAPSHMLPYKNALQAVAADMGHATRILVGKSVLRGAQHMVLSPGMPPAKVQYYVSVVESTASMILQLVDEICMSVPCILNVTAEGGNDDPSSPEEIHGFRALAMFWPLITATVVLNQEEVQQRDLRFRQAFISCVLAFLRNNMGLVKAQAYIHPPAALNIPQRVIGVS